MEKSVSNLFIDGGGSLTVENGADFKIINDNGLYVGDIGAGELKIQGGGVASTGEGAFIGNNTGSNGTVTVNGAGSNWTTTFLYLGGNGTGELNIQGGGRINRECFNW